MWLLYAVSTIPEIQEKLYEQIKANGAKDAITAEDIKNIPLLKNIVQESMRYCLSLFVYLS